MKKKLRIRRCSVLISLLLISSTGSKGANEVDGSRSGDQLFIPNQGQWHDNVRFKSRVPGGDFFLEDKGFTYHRVDQEKLHELHHQLVGKGATPAQDLKVRAHAVKVRLLGADDPRIKKEGRSDYYENHYRGADPEKWASKVHPYEAITLEEVYEGTDLRFERNRSGVKYSFELAADADPTKVRMDYEGQEELRKGEEGKLLIGTSLGDIEEMAPEAYQNIGGKRVKVPCEFQVKGSTVSFHFPEGYDKGKRLVIDPNVIFSSYTGSTPDNWGNTATYDDDGALYAGGTVFGSGYPTTSGAYQLNFGGGGSGLGCDVAISKFAPNGSSLDYSTYLGGSSNELPHSLVVNDLGQLYVLGSTGSSDFPTSTTAAIPNFQGGISGTAFGSIQFSNGSDAFISKFAIDGTSLLGSTYMGGTGNDGLNEATDLNHNYGDILRGEIEVDGDRDCYIVSTTNSSDLPTTTGAFQDSLAGGQDAFVAKLSSDLSSILFCSYYGGSGDDAGYALERSPSEGLYISGGTESSDLPAPSGWQTNAQGGVDGYIARFDLTASTLQDASYIGTSSYDQAYFVGRDTSDNILLYGQSNGTYPVHNVSYTNPNSGQFIEKLPPDLSSSLLSTVFGTGSGTADISPSAFMVSSCNNIYLSGWGGTTNQSHGVNGSTTNGLPTTNNAFQSSTDGSDFYLMVLGSNASSLKYASFFGGGTSGEHVDGGTSRFDEDGVVYQAVCAGCGGNNDFPTTAGAHSQTNNSGNCNLAAFKFDMSQLTASINAHDPPLACQADTFTFEFDGSGGNSYIWDFGDGSMDTGSTVSHFYNDTGSYQVTLIVQDTLTCNSADTATTMVHVFPPISPSVDSINPICPGDSVQLSLSQGFDPIWSPTASLDDPTVEDPLSFPDTSTQYQVIAQGCDNDSNLIEDTLNVTVSILDINSQAFGDTTICKGDTVSLHSSGAASLDWSPSSSLDDPTAASPLAFPQDTTEYTVTLTDTNGCENEDSVLVQLHEDPTLSPKDTTVCKGSSVELHPQGPAGSYLWSPSGNLDDSTLMNPTAIENDSTLYTVQVTDNNGCSTSDSLMLTTYPDPQLSPQDTAICKFDSVQLQSNGSTGSYVWSPSSGLDDPTKSSPMAVGDDSIQYDVTVTDSNGCSTSDSLQLDIIGPPPINAHSDTSICDGDTVQLWVNGGVQQEWSPTSSLNNGEVSNPIAFPDSSTLYHVTVTDAQGCQNFDSVSVDTVPIPEVTTSPDTFLCFGDSMPIFASGGSSYQWSPPASLSDPTSPDPIASPNSSTHYQVEVFDANGCSNTGGVTLTLDTAPPHPQTSKDTIICKGDTAQLDAGGGHLYEWSPEDGLTPYDVSDPIASPSNSITYFVHMTNGCGNAKDSVHVKVNDPEAKAGPDTMLCSEGDSIRLYASGGGNYLWSPQVGLEAPRDSTTMANIQSSTDYTVTVTDSIGCQDSETARVNLSDDPELSVGEDIKVEWGSRVILSAEGESGQHYWHPPEFFEDPTDSRVSFNATEDGVFWVELTDSSGCRTVDSIRVEVSGSLYAPNAFTPDGDGINDIWRPQGKKIEEYHLQIFDRWGEKVFESHSLENGWDGRVNGHPAKPDVYVYKIEYSEKHLPTEMKERTGEITLIR